MFHPTIDHDSRCWALRFSSITSTSNRGACKANMASADTSDIAHANQLCHRGSREHRPMPPASSTLLLPQHISYNAPNHQYITTITAPGASHERSGSSCSPQQHSISIRSQPAASAASVRTPQSTAPNSLRHHAPPRLSARSALMEHTRIDHMRRYVMVQHHAVTGGRPRQASRQTQDIAEGTNNI